MIFKFLNSKDGNETIIQMDEPLSSLTQDQALEYMAIFNKPPEKPPFWFSKMPKWHQNYLKNKIQTIHNKFKQDKLIDETSAKLELVKSLNDTLSSPPSTIRYYPGLANYTKHTLIILDQDGNEILRSSKERGSTATVESIRPSIDDDENRQNSYNQDRERLSKQNLEQLITPKRIQTKLSQFKSDWDIEIQDDDEFTLPIVYTSNLSPLVVDSYAEVMRKNKWYKKYNEGSTHYDNNSLMRKEKDQFFKKVLAETNTKIRTSLDQNGYRGVKLSGISTNYAINNERALATPQPDLRQNQEKLISDTVGILNFIATKKNGSSPRQDLNLTQDPRSDLDILIKARQTSQKEPTRNLDANQKLRYNTILDSLIQYKRIVDAGLSESKNDQKVPTPTNSTNRVWILLSVLLQPGTRNVAKSLWEVSKKREDKENITKYDQTNNNLFLASYEQIIAQQTGGIGFGHCKSGKDRKGLEIVHTDAMLIYYRKYNKFPADHNDNAFVDILVKHLKTNHQQLMVTYNAPGCCGLQNLITILPTNVALRFVEEMERNHENAKLNKPGIKSIRKFIKGSEEEPFRPLTSDTQFQETEKNIQQTKINQISQHQNRGLSQLQRNSNSPIIRNEDIKLTTDKRLVDIKSLNSAFDNITTNKTSEYSIIDTKVEDKGSYSECTYKLQDNTEHMLTVDVSGIEMKEFNRTSVKISIEMLIKTYGTNAELSYDGMNEQQIAECEQIRSTIIESYNNSSTSPSVTLDEQNLSTPSNRNPH